MSDKEILRGQLMAQLLEGKLDQRAAAARLFISVHLETLTEAEPLAHINQYVEEEVETNQPSI